MWLTPKSDQTSVKDLIFSELYNECRLAAPGAKLSYSCRSKLERLSREERKELVSRIKEGCSPLFVSCKRGNVDIVEFLIEECGADVEQKGVYEVPDDRSIHYVTPIWCASVAGKLNVVKCLVKHGADVNSASDTGSTPVRSACFMTHLEIVKFLVESGADIVKANFNGGTCLINSVQSVPLCQLLLQNGAPVNALDIQHKTALHYAIQEHRFETTRLLLQYGADPMIKSRYGDDALQTACLKVATQIFVYLIQHYPYSKERIADAYELLGSTFLDDHYDIQTALTYWRSALDIRYSLLNQNNPLLSSTSGTVDASSSSSSSSAAASSSQASSSTVSSSYNNLAAQISSLINASSPLTSPSLPSLASSSSSATLFNCTEDTNALDKLTGQPSNVQETSCDLGNNFNNNNNNTNNNMNNNDRQTDGISLFCCDNECNRDKLLSEALALSPSSPSSSSLSPCASSSSSSTSTCTRSSALLRSLIKKNLVPPKYAYGYVVEFTTYEELDVLALDLDLMRIQSLLICERILGTAHKDMIFRLMYRGASYADSLQYQRCIEFWIYALDLRYAKDTMLHTEASYATQALVRLFLEIQEKSAARLLREELQFEHVFLTVKLIFNQLPFTIRCLQQRPVFKKQQDTFDKILKVTVNSPSFHYRFYLTFSFLLLTLSHFLFSRIFVPVFQYFLLPLLSCAHPLCIGNFSATRALSSSSFFLYLPRLL